MAHKLAIILLLLWSSSSFAFGKSYESFVDEQTAQIWRLDTSSNELSTCYIGIDRPDCSSAKKLSSNLSLVGAVSGYIWLINKKSGEVMHCALDPLKMLPICSKATRN